MDEGNVSVVASGTARRFSWTVMVAAMYVGGAVFMQMWAFLTKKDFLTGTPNMVMNLLFLLCFPTALFGGILVGIVGTKMHDRVAAKRAFLAAGIAISALIVTIIISVYSIDYTHFD